MAPRAGGGQLTARRRSSCTTGCQPGCICYRHDARINNTTGRRTPRTIHSRLAFRTAIETAIEIAIARSWNGPADNADIATVVGCSVAEVETVLIYLDSVATEPVRVVTHGLHRYRAGCRCEVCVGANRDRVRRQTKTRSCA